MYLSNTPQSQVILRAEARKSFAIGLWIQDPNGKPLDITDTSIRLVLRDAMPLDPTGDDLENLVVSDSAVLVDPVKGYAELRLQASDIALRPKEYPYTIVLVDKGYSSVIVKGTMDVLPNTEYSSVSSEYVSANPAAALDVVLRDHVSIAVRTGSILPPGTTTFTDRDKAKLDSIEEGAQVHIVADWNAGDADSGYIRNKPPLGTAAFAELADIALPRGGFPGEVLTKRSNVNRDVFWARPPGGGGGGGGLDAEGVTAGYVPTASGLDSWSWLPVVAGVSSVNGLEGQVILTLDDISDTATRAAMTPDMIAKLEGLQLNPEWSRLVDVPLFGTAALSNTEDFLAPLEVDGADVTTGEISQGVLPKILDHRGISYGFDPPTGGEDGDIYFQLKI